MNEIVKRDNQMMLRAISNAENARLISSPNPWVGAVLELGDGSLHDGWTQEPGQEHAEIMCLVSAGAKAEGGTLYTTLEPCSHTGKTPPCVESIIASKVKRVVIGISDPDPLVSGAGARELKAAGIEVSLGTQHDEVSDQLQPYLHHRKTGRPYVILKIAASLDGGIAAPDQTSQWITGPEAREEAHKLRAQSDAICVGVGTVIADNPKLTVRDWAPENKNITIADPKRIVLGKVPREAAIHPCLEHEAGIEELLDQLGQEGIMQLLVEGGANTYKRFHDLGVVNQYEIFLAPIFFGGNNAKPMFSGDATETLAEIWRGKIKEAKQIGVDVKITVTPEDQ
ncbi:MAG: bifunctional diaminohydroxyphosphoribosylaminopyrimidine deaminase/5-amino-6-(5-phosphoribosylamino)uracil reductase RibD [Actinomycetota bacterium]